MYRQGLLVTRRTELHVVAQMFLYLMAAILVSSCGDKQSREQRSDQYADWQKYTYGHFVFHLSPVSRYGDDKVGMARGYDRILAQACDILEMPVPEEKINLFVYSNPAECEKMTGQTPPFSDDSAIYWDGRYASGYQLTKFLLEKRGIKPGRFDVVNEGIPTLLDFSGKNYHDLTNRLANSGTFVPLDKLGDNRVFDTLNVSIKRNESASLMGFIMHEYGLDNLFRLNSSFEEWPTAIETIFGMSAVEFELKWLVFARGESDDPDATTSN